MADFGKDLKQAMREAADHAQGKKTGVAVHNIEAVDIKAIRTRMKVTQNTMAAYLGVSVSGYRKWEQGQRFPNGAARTLLKVMDREPEAVLKALAS